MRSAFLLATLLGLTACTEFRQAPGVIAQPTKDWRQVATESDRKRLRDWRTSFVKALDAARKAGHAAEIAKEGALFEPDAALGGEKIPNGDYRCRVTKLGTKSPGLLPYIAYPAFKCRVRADGELQELSKIGGSQRQVGIVFPGDDLRQVFLGTLVLGDERRAMQYGRDKDRDIAGFLERIGPNRWRLIMPEPAFESQMDVMELVPSTAGAR